MSENARNIDKSIVIQVDHLDKVYPLHAARLNHETGMQESVLYALRKVSFALEEGQSVGIIGPNGSGKSTLLRILAGITKPNNGTALIKGRTASILDIGAGFHPYLSGRENIYLNGQLLGFSKKEIDAQFDAIVAFSGVEDFLSEPVKNYSSGMYLRLAFSIMANLDFDVYLLDEVMGVGDAAFQKQSSQRLKELIASGKTCLFASHNFLELKQLFKRFFYIQNGHLEMLDVNEVAERLGYSALPILEYLPATEAKDFKIKKVRILNDLMNHGKISRVEPVVFEIDYQVKNKLSKLEFAVRLKKDNIPFAFFPMRAKHLQINDSNSTHKMQLKIPGNFLNEGFYSVDLFAGETDENYLENYDCMNFQIELETGTVINVIDPIVVRFDAEGNFCE
jgi:ABC-type polysaccharide/polyol phosphate transport system ATPase subunit